jgi:transposase-like protein
MRNIGLHVHLKDREAILNDFKELFSDQCNCSTQGLK